MTPIAPLITSFLREHMPIEQGCSPHTCETYAHAFRLLFIFASKRLGIKPYQICIEQLDAALVLDFLSHIEEQRGNCAATRNGRLAAVKAFIRYVEFRVPSALAQAQQIHAIPSKRHDQGLVRHLTMEEVRAILNAPNTTTRLGIRDRAMLHLCFAGGLRVSELVGLPLESVRLERTASIRVLGKGRRERCLPLWKESTVDLRAWMAVRGAPPVPELFVNAEGTAMTRAGFEYILGKHVCAASKSCPSLSRRSVSPISFDIAAPSQCSKLLEPSVRWHCGSATLISARPKSICAWIQRKSWRLSRRLCHSACVAGDSKRPTR